MLNTKKQILNNDRLGFSGSVFLPKGSEGILLNPRTGGWAVMSTKLHKLLSKTNGKTFEDVIKDGFAGAEECSEILLKLYNLGLCKLNGHGVVEDDFWNCYGNDTPRLLILKTTNACNLKCHYCYSKITDNYNSPVRIDPTFIDKIVSDLVKLNKVHPVHLNFHGGEPLLCSDLIIDTVRRLRSVGFNDKTVEFSIQTNGTLLDESMIDFCKKNDISISISLDGHAEVNDAIRVFPDGKGSFLKVENSIDLCNDLKFQRLSILTTITKRNVQYLPVIVKEFQRMGISHVKFTLFAAWGAGKSHNDLAPSSGEVVKAYSEILASIERGELKDIFIETLANYVNNLVYFDRLYMCMRSPCGAGLSVITLDTDGSIYACDCGIGADTFLLGNLHDSLLAEILKGRRNTLFKKRQVQNIEQCLNCCWRALCMGTCTHRAYISHGTIYAADPLECDLNKKMYEMLIWRLYENPDLLNYFAPENGQRMFHE